MKTFKTYSEAYALYSDILSGREPDRKNASISFVPAYSMPFVVLWEQNTLTN